MVSGGDGYFFYNRKIDDILTYSETETTEISQAIEKRVLGMTEGLAEIGWNIYEDLGEQYLLFVADSNAAVFGGWINLNKLIEDLKKSMDFSDYNFSFTDDKLDLDQNYVSVCAEKNGVCLNISILKRELLKKMSGQRKIHRAISWIYLLVIPLLYFLLRKLLLEPLYCVINAHRRLREGNLTWRINEKANSGEYKEVFLSFNEMADQIYRLKIEAYEKEISRQEMELSNLQLQIRPHFLLNTFNMIFVLTKSSKEEAKCAIQDVVIYLSDYFRLIVRGENDRVIFPKEEHMLRGYARLIEIRYQDRVKMTFDFDPEIMMIRIPPLLLLNFAENSVRHGLRSEGELHVDISGKYDNGFVEFVIYDDGNGIEEQNLEKLQKVFAGEYEPDQGRSHIGLYNSWKRMRYIWGEEAEITVMSVPGIETEFVIRFPYMLEENDEFINRER